MNFLSSQTAVPLLDALQQLYPDSSKRTLKQWILNGRVSLNGQVVKKPHALIKQKDKVDLLSKERELKNNIKILYSDRYLIVIDKPAGLLSVPSEISQERNALEGLRFYLKDDKIYQVHRIDQQTSGVMVFARGKLSAEKLSNLFLSHDIKRQYHALVEGEVEKEKGVWESYIKELENFSMVEVDDASQGKLAITHYEIIKRFPGFTLLCLTLKTGKKHQIRLHCKEAGHPILGDVRYNSSYPDKRVALHASLLGFMHPFLGKEMQFKSPLPQFIQTAPHLRSYEQEPSALSLRTKQKPSIY